jgi:hypothetical protein
MTGTRRQEDRTVRQKETRRMKNGRQTDIQIDRTVRQKVTRRRQTDGNITGTRRQEGRKVRQEVNKTNTRRQTDRMVRQKVDKHKTNNRRKAAWQALAGRKAESKQDTDGRQTDRQAGR